MTILTNNNIKISCRGPVVLKTNHDFLFSENIPHIQYKTQLRSKVRKYNLKPKGMKPTVILSKLRIKMK